MSKVCQVTGRRPAAAKSVSHSHRRTPRWQYPNVHKKRYWVPSERRYVTLVVSTKGMKVVDRRGIDSVVAELRRKGEL
jgi:large subunit ribosomal protein L28